jgi:hypothetical protein
MSAPRRKQQKAERKALRVESNNPAESNQWTFLWELDKDEWVKTQILIDELNILNAPVLLRIVPNEHQK